MIFNRLSYWKCKIKWVVKIYEFFFYINRYERKYLYSGFYLLIFFFSVLKRWKIYNKKWKQKNLLNMTSASGSFGELELLQKVEMGFWTFVFILYQRNYETFFFLTTCFSLGETEIFNIFFGKNNKFRSIYFIIQNKSNIKLF